MKKFLTNFLKFLPFAVLVYLVLLFLWCSVTPLYLHKNLNFWIGSYGHMHSRMRDAKKVGKVEALIIGSSHAYRGFDSRIFRQHGISAFNMGSSSQTPIQSLMLLENYVDSLEPKLVIIEVYPEIFSLDGVESSLDILANEHINRNTAIMAYTINHLQTWNSLLYGTYRQLTGLDRNFVQPPNEYKDHYIQGTGYVEREMEFFKDTTYTSSSWEFNKKQLKAFDRILEILHKKNISILLVQAPFTKALYQSKTNNAEVDSFLLSKGTYLNFNNLAQLDDSLHFYDADHLNQEGVKIFNDSLLSWMAVHYPPRGPDSNR